MSLALVVFLVGTLPELGRMIAFRNFETFEPAGPGLGNLFGQISPLEALGVWPSGDFRVAPGDGAVPAIAVYLGAAFAAALLVCGLVRCWRRRELATVAGLLAAAAVYVAARIGGTPYTTAKAIEIAAPLCTLAILLPLLGAGGGGWGRLRRRADQDAKPLGGRGSKTVLSGLACPTAAIYLLAAGGCSLLALANAPVGPVSYSPALTGLRPLLARDSTLVLAPAGLLDDQHGARYIAWELRGGRVCVEPEAAAAPTPPPGVRFVVTTEPATGGSGARSTRTWTAFAPYPGFRLRRVATPYLLWERTGPVGGQSPCPLIAVRQARQGPAR